MGSKTRMLVGINSWLKAETDESNVTNLFRVYNREPFPDIHRVKPSQIRNSVYLRATDTCFNELSQINNELACVLTEYQRKIAQKKTYP